LRALGGPDHQPPVARQAATNFFDETDFRRIVGPMYRDNRPI
jgi:hypothetical protein